MGESVTKWQIAPLDFATNQDGASSAVARLMLKSDAASAAARPMMKSDAASAAAQQMPKSNVPSIARRRAANKENGMFVGEYSHSIDQKGRIIIPSRFREQLGDEIIVTAGLDGCLFAYAEEEWSAFEEKLYALPISNPSARKFSRFFLASAGRCEIDKMGRILLPQKLRDMAGLSKDVILAGVGNRIEIWDKDKWAAVSAYEDMDEVAANMEGLGI